MLLLVLIASALAVAPASKKAVHLPGAPAGTPNMFSGYATVNETYGAELFYWFVENESPSAPLILWLTGGPGCSSELALLFENGPLNLQSDGSLVKNPYGWNEAANVLYVDSPVGTGFSKELKGMEAYCTEEQCVASDLFTFLQAFFLAFPQYRENEFHILGESYAGHYTFALGSYIQRHNRRRDTQAVNLKSVNCGNGMTNPRKQYSEFASFSEANGLISHATRVFLEESYKQCDALLEVNSPKAGDVCNLQLGVVQQEAGNFNVYDMQMSCPPSNPLCYDFDPLTKYLNDPAVQTALGVSRKWATCDGDVYTTIAPTDWFVSEQYTVPVLLDDYNVTIYNGMNDWICNHAGNYKWVREMPWHGKAAFNNATRAIWKDPDTGLLLGYQQDSKMGLDFVWFRDAGHMVPHDAPAAALHMVKSIVNHTPLF